MMSMSKMKLKKNSRWGKLLAGIGIATVLSEVVLRLVSMAYHKEYELDHWVIAIGAVIGFAGFWSIDDEKTKAATEVVTKLLPHFGRRSTDAVAVPTAETTILAKHIPTEYTKPSEEKPEG